MDVCVFSGGAGSEAVLWLLFRSFYLPDDFTPCCSFLSIPPQTNAFFIASLSTTEVVGSNRYKKNLKQNLDRLDNLPHQSWFSLLQRLEPCVLLALQGRDNVLALAGCSKL